MISRLPDNCSTLYADLMQKVSLYAPSTQGAFVSKTIKGSRYWYHQTDTVAGRKQTYLGQESDALLTEIASRKAIIAAHRELLSERRRLVAMLSVAGAHLEKGRAAKIIEKLSDANLFTTGGVMVGSFAFACYGNMLGINMLGHLSRTEDIDFSVARTVDVAFNRNMKEVLLEAEPQLREPIQINPRIIPFEMVTPDGFKVEFLTTKVSHAEDLPVHIERFDVYAQPLDFMDYLLADAQSAVVLNGAGILVSVPHPARFALHKLAISQLRPIGLQTKIRKDFDQAALLLTVLVQDNPGTLMLAMEALYQRSDALAHFVNNAIERLEGALQEKVIEAFGRALPVVKLDTRTGQIVTQNITQ
jgi:hypothetical protein